jgi:uncharacterized membrane protein YtjA (UPF0391 family)
MRIMLSWAFIFLLLAVVAGFLGFGGIALLSAEIARLLCVAFVLLFILACFIHVLRGKMPPI